MVEGAPLLRAVRMLSFQGVAGNLCRACVAAEMAAGGLAGCDAAPGAAPGAAGGGLVRVVDGDTIEVRGRGVRIAGIDAPEAGRARCVRERRLAERAADAVREMVAGGVWLEPVARDIFGRTVARVIAADGRDVGAELVAEGLAVEWTPGRKRPQWCRAVR